MPQLNRPDGGRIHWEQLGDGPALYVLHNPVTATPSTFDALLTDLARDHRLVTLDPRGAGRSGNDGPYDLATDAGDLGGVIEHVSGHGVTMSLGLVPTPLALAELRPALIAAVVMVGGLGFSGGTDPDSLLDSESVTALSLQQAKTGPRGLQRAAIALGNPQLDEAGVRQRLEEQIAYCPVESWVGRAESYLGYDARRACAALGDRLWLLHWVNPISPGRPMKHMREMLPDAHIVEIEDGPISRPDLTAAVVREATAALRRESRSS